MNQIKFDNINKIQLVLNKLLFKIKEEFNLSLINAPIQFLYDKDNISSIKYISNENLIYELNNNLKRIYDEILNHKIKTYSSNVIFKYEPISLEYSNSLFTNLYDSICFFYDCKIDANLKLNDIVVNLVNIFNDVFKDEKTFPNAFKIEDFELIKPTTFEFKIDKLIIKMLNNNKYLILNNAKNYHTKYLTRSVFDKVTKIIFYDNKKIYDLVEIINDQTNNMFFININIYKLLAYVYDFKYISDFKWIDLFEKNNKKEAKN